MIKPKCTSQSPKQRIENKFENVRVVILPCRVEVKPKTTHGTKNTTARWKLGIVHPIALCVHS